MSNSYPKLKVLTPKLYSSNNYYLEQLWTAVEACGIEVSQLEWTQSSYAFYKEPKKGSVCHFHWVHELCSLGKVKNPETWKSLFSSSIKLCILKSKGYQVVWTVHNTLSHESPAPKLEQYFRWLLNYICDDVVVMSQHSQKEFNRIYGRTNRVHIIPHGNYIGVYPNQITRKEARQKLGITSEQKVILHFGRIMKYKGTSDLVASFNRLSDPKALLLIAGTCQDAKLLHELKNAASLNPKIFLMLDFVPDAEIQVYMNACDWVVLPFRKILNSGSVMLALSFGKPVIVRQNGSISEVVCNGEQGFSYCDRSELLDVLNCSLTLSFLEWEKMCENALKTAQEYNWSKIGLKLCNVYKKNSKQ